MPRPGKDLPGDFEDPINRSRRDLERVSTFLSSIVENIPAMIFVKNAESLRFELFNKAGEALLGIPREQLLGKADTDLFPPDQAAFFVEKDRRVLEDKQLVDIPLEPIDTAAGRRWLHTKKIPVVDREGVARYLLGISLDITERHEAEESLRRVQDELERRVALRTRELSLTVARLEREISDRERAESALQKSEDQLRHAQKMDAVGRLAGGVAHDFNNMLSVILGHTEMALARLDTDDEHELFDSLDTIRQAALRSAGLTQQLLAFSRQQVVSPRHLDLRGLVRDFDKMLKRVIGDDIKLVIVESAEACAVRVDPVQMEQVILNLAINARDAMPHGGHLTIETKLTQLSPEHVFAHPNAKLGPHVELCVRDEGTGMDAVTLGRIFEPFFTTKAEGRGTGLGLSTVYGIVHQAGGSLIVDSALNQGSTFRVFLPYAAGRDSWQPVGGAPARGGQERVLLVEDEPEVRRVCALTLQRLGYEVVVAEDEEHAVKLCATAERPLHAVVTDVVMPGTSGVALVQRLRVLQPGIRVLFMSGYTDRQIVDTSSLNELSAFLQKPFTPDSLGRQLRQLLDARRIET
ncbi:MAG: PAS domain-containing sensor histidine kinase [Myxococcales bacterium]|nr:MAG: PAS domain-containing sensor histidine kinase [Myxococcales bacterium]